MGKNYKQLSIEVPTLIQTQMEMGIKPAEIGWVLGRSASTLSREARTESKRMDSAEGPT